MKILICSTGYNSMTYDHTIGCFQLDQAKALRDIGNNVRIASIDLRSIRRKRRLGTYVCEISGIKAATSNFPYGGLPFWRLESCIASVCAQKAYRFITADGWVPDVIHAHFCDVAAAFSEIAHDAGIPFVVTEHYSKMHQKAVEDKILKAAQKAYSGADALISVSQSLADSIYEKTGYCAKVIHNIVDTDVFEPKHTEKSGQCFTFVSAGHLRPIKGMDLLIKAFSQLETEYKRLIILGDGIERANLEKMAKENGCDKQIVFYGEYQRPEFQKILEDADCFVLPSRSETFGVVYIEAMACGIPVIGTDCGGPSEFITKESGLLIPVEDTARLTQAMYYMLEHAHEYDHRMISRYAKEMFGRKNIAKQIQAVYDEMVNNG